MSAPASSAVSPGLTGLCRQRLAPSGFPLAAVCPLPLGAALFAAEPARHHLRLPVEVEAPHWSDERWSLGREALR
jgi:hypothetical protein